MNHRRQRIKPLPPEQNHCAGLCVFGVTQYLGERQDMMKKGVKLIILGGLSPFIGVLIFLIQLQINPHGIVKYIIVQAAFTALFLLYFFFCAYLCADKNQRKNIAYFFIVPVAFLLLNVLFEQIQENVALAAIVSGVNAPFHYVLPYLYFSQDKITLIPNALPVVVCMIAFQMGEKVGCLLKK
jgi:small-conductance mechanosensitive channel